MAFLWLLPALLLVISPVSSESDYDSAKSDLTDDLKIVCYYSNWAIYRPGLAKFTPQNINPYLCTHIIYAFAGLSSHFELKPFDPYNDIEQGNYKKFVGLKTYNPKLKTLIAVGGWNEGSKRFSQLVASYTNRQRFVRSAVRFLREHGFDGLDLDWEYPGFRDGGSEGDKAGYTQLIRELREAFELERVPLGKGKLVLSVAVPAGQEYIDKGFEVSAISKLVDFMSILSYDYHTAYESETHHHAPLFSRPDFTSYDERNKFTVEWTVDYYLQKGAAKEKLIVGIPTYGRSYTLADHKDYDLEAPADGPGEPGPATREKGYLAYYEICQKIKDEDWNVKRPYPKLLGPFAYKNDQWVGYDDEQVIAEKARFIMERGLGGAMVWTLDNDDFRGICSGEQSPLITALRTALLSNIIQSSSSQRPVARAISETRPLPLTPPPVDFDDEDYLPATEAPKKSRRPQPPPDAPPHRSVRQQRQRNQLQRQSDAFRTPAPPPTPDPGPAFECPDEGFFNNPRDCKKYFWCLDSGPANLGIVPHAFTCPSGLYFNSGTDSCDYPENVVCRVRSDDAYTTAKPARPRLRPTTSTTTTTTTTTEPPLPLHEEDALNALNNYQTPNRESSSNENVAQLLRLLQTLGGVERLQSLLGSQDESEKEASTTTTQSFLPARPTYPDYVTPRRNVPTTESFLEQTQTTERPAVANEYQPPFSPVPYRPSTLPDESRQQAPQNQVPRRPQFETPTTLSPFLEYNEPNRQRRPIAQGQDTAQTPFSFVYNTPGRGREQAAGDSAVAEAFPTAPSALQTPATDSPFSYHTPPRTLPTTTQVVPLPETTTEPAIITQTDIPPNALRVPVRVQAGRVVRIHAGEGGAGGNGKRRSRVRVRPVHRDRVAAAGSTDEVEAPEDGTAIVGNSQPARQGGGRRVGVRRRPVLDLPKAVTARKVIKPVNAQELPPVPDNQNFKPQQEFFVGRRPVEQSADDNYFLDQTTPAPTTSRSGSRRIRPGYRPPQFTTRPEEVEYEFTESPFTTEPPPPPPPPRTIVSLPASGGSGGRRSGQRRPTTAKGTSFTVTTTTTTPKPRPRPTTTPRPRPVASQTDPPFVVDNDGKVDCYKRGNFRHPQDCSRFIVCAPYPKNPSGWRAFIHNCPANQIYLENIGRCMRGDRSKCEAS